MSTKDPLKKLMRRFPAPDELKATLHTLGQGDDRTVAIVGASVLEALLERVMKKRLKRCDPILAGQLFYNRGPLSDFHGKIIIAHASGFISPALASELHLIKAVRNAFAHAVVGISFETEEVRGKMADSVILRAMNSVETEHEIPFRQYNAKSLAMIVHIIAIFLDNDHQMAGGDPLMELMTVSPEDAS